MSQNVSTEQLLKLPVSNEQSILIDLDSILDTRYGVLFQQRPGAAVQALSSKDYYTRQINDFTSHGGLNVKDFEEAFARRDHETLKHSPVTGFVFALRTMMDDLALQRQNSPFAENVGLVINHYPYELQPAELQEMRRLINVITGIGENRIHFDWISWESMTPAYLKQSFTGIILYNFREWMEIQQEAFVKLGMPSVVVLAPALYKDAIPDQKDMQVKGYESLSPFEIGEGALVACFDLSFLSMKFFSAIPPEELAHAAASQKGR